MSPEKYVIFGNSHSNKEAITLIIMVLGFF